jgi:hypothetical protein
MPFLILSILIQVALVVHIVRTGRAFFWVWIVLIFPPVGPLAYIIVEILPDIGRSRFVRDVKHAVRNMIDPHRDVRLHSEALEVSATVENSIKLANMLRDKGNLQEALELYTKAQTGLYATDPALLLGKADILYRMKSFTTARETLDFLIKENPDYKSPDGHMLYATCLDAEGNESAAIHEYEILCKYYPGPEPKCRYGLLLKRKGEMEKARELFQEVQTAAKRSGKHYHKLHKEWIELAQKELL